MSAWFNKKGRGSSSKDSSGVVDFVALQKRGLIKTTERKPHSEGGIKADAYGYADLTSSQNFQSPSPPEKSQSSDETINFFSSISESSSSSFFDNNQKTNSISEPNSNLLKNKIEDVEYKLDSIGRKLSNIIDRMEVAEKRLDRIEGRSN